MAILLPALAASATEHREITSEAHGFSAQTPVSTAPGADEPAAASSESSGDLTALEQDLLRAERELASSALSSGRLQYDRGQYWEAVESLKLAAKLSPDESEVFDLLGRALWQVGQSRIAEQCMRRTLDLRRRDLGPDDPLVATSLNTLADFLTWHRRFEEAETTVSEALNVVSRGPGEESPEYVLALLTRAKLLAAQQEYLQALAETARALKIQKRITGHKHPAVADILNLKAKIFMDRAIDHWRGARAARRPSPGRWRSQQLEFARAEAAQALEIARATRRKDHPEIAYVLITLARLDPWVKPGGLAGRGMAPSGGSSDLRRTAPPPNPGANGAENEIEATFWAQEALRGIEGEGEKGIAIALAHITEAQQILFKELGAVNPTMAETYVIRAELHFWRREFDQAEQWARRALALYPRFVGPEDPRLGFGLKVLADVLDQNGPQDEAAAARRRAYEILGARDRPTMSEMVAE